MVEKMTRFWSMARSACALVSNSRSRGCYSARQRAGGLAHGERGDGVLAPAGVAEAVTADRLSRKSARRTLVWNKHVGGVSDASYIKTGRPENPEKTTKPTDSQSVGFVIVALNGYRQSGNLNDAIRVLQLNEPLAFKYPFV
jgi:hypothetical protein